MSLMTTKAAATAGSSASRASTAWTICALVCMRKVGRETGAPSHTCVLPAPRGPSTSAEVPSPLTMDRRSSMCNSLCGRGRHSARTHSDETNHRNESKRSHTESAWLFRSAAHHLVPLLTRQIDSSSAHCRRITLIHHHIIKSIHPARGHDESTHHRHIVVTYAIHHHMDA